MKVYLVYNCYFDNIEYTNGSILLGIYSSRELAEEACHQFIQDEMADCTAEQCISSIDEDGLPTITKFDKDGEPYEINTFTIEEWCVA
jgi:hypothetical protein